MAPVAMSQMTTYRWTFEEDLRRYEAAGYDAVGIWRQKLSDFGEEAGQRLLSAVGLQVSSLSWAGGFTGGEGLSHAEAVDDARAALNLAAALRANCLIVHSGARGLHTQNHVRRLLHQAIESLLPRAESLDVTMALEPMHPAAAGRWTFLNDLGEALRLVESYRSPHLKLVFDCYDWGRTNQFRAILPQLVPQLALVQVADGPDAPCSDRSRSLLGSGTIPVGKLIEDLSAAGYRRPWEIELLGEDIESCDYERLLGESLPRVKQWAAAGEPASIEAQAASGAD